ncbi:Mitogen-activated protein kinase kinase kinase 17 [Vitis vinifera]|uniref:Mitogen-activated protein kinase kinase kinase 17 n=1 Tax=Vitis vinifera TaxID=29760 RepID=A0A438J6M8_VITVI|nr:Mitogen-activated protein kinase kinase kinase 17 [Vitis vinifera]
MEHMITKGILVGVGSSGKVHMAFSNGRLLGLKSSCSSCYSSLQKEEEILHSLGHCPDIVDCFGGYSTQEGNGVLVYNLVLEYAPGLRDVHKEGFVHCDLKVDNILVFHSENGGHKVKIADFGHAKRSGREEFSGALGSQHTSDDTPPECSGNGENEAPKDIWSLGCLVVEMFTGKPAWMSCKDVNELAVRIVSWRQVPKVLGNISEDAKDFLRRCLEKDPTERWTAERLLSHPFIAQVPASQ